MLFWFDRRKHYLCISAPAMPLPDTPPQPGPGTYETVNYDGQPKHYMSSAAFVSTTSRWTGTGREGELPGPCKLLETYTICTQVQRINFVNACK